jgi:hypothetical protein
LPSQAGLHWQTPLMQPWPVGQVSAWQRPPQPSRSPHFFPAQAGTQVHWADRQLWPVWQVGVQLQESLQMPLAQNEPLVQVTPAQGLVTQLPATQDLPVPHWTWAHGSGCTHDMLQVVPVGHQAAQAVIGRHWPPEQYSPEGHFTPAQGTRKQPLMQLPSEQVSPALQVTEAQRSVVGTQLARHWLGAVQMDEAAQGSAEHL